MIISGGENISPVEIESCLSLHPAVSEVAVAGLPDERWGKIVCAFIKPRAAVEADDARRLLPPVRARQFQAPAPLRASSTEIPKSPVGKILRRKLVAGEYQPERSLSTRCSHQGTRHDHPDDFRRSRASRKLDGFRVEIDPERERADMILDRPPLNVIEMPQRDQLRLVFEALDEDPRVRVIVLRGGRRAFFQRRQHQGLSGSLARARVQARLEHRGAGALREAGDRRQSRLLLRRRL